MSDLTNSIRQALDATDLLTAATDVKLRVCEELARVDPAAEIRRTDYFNHSFVPDVVVKWASEPPREVFLRFMGADSVQEDLDRIGSSGPVLVDLSAATAPGAREERLLATSVAIESQPSVLITDTEATEHIRPSDSTNLVEHLVVSNVLRAGRGQLTESTAIQAVTESRAGFVGATDLDANAVQAAVEVARSLLSPEVERRVEKSMQLLWWAGGGSPEDFPVTVPDDMVLNPSDTREFLRMMFTDTQLIDDPAFWSRLADRLSFDMLVEAGEVRSSENLNHLMKALASRIELSHAVIDRHERPFPPDDELRWALSDSFLRLVGPDWSCRFTPHGNRFSQRRDEGTAIVLDAAKERSEGLFVEEAEISEAARRVHLTRTGVDPAAHRGTSLAALTQGFADDARVRSIVVQVGPNRITGEFDRMLLSSSPDAPVLRMATLATQLLLSMTSDDSEALARFLDSD